MHVVLSRKSLISVASSLYASVGFVAKREDRLVHAARVGDTEAFEGLRRIYAPIVRRFIARRVAGADLDDLVQETWLGAWEGIRRFEDRGKFRAWVLRIAFRRVQDFRRKERSRPAFGSFEEGEHEGYRPAAFGAVELRVALSDYWAVCKPETRELLTMYYAEGFTLAEISAITGRNLNTVKSHFYKAHDDAVKTFPGQEEALLGRELTA